MHAVSYCRLLSVGVAILAAPAVSAQSAATAREQRVVTTAWLAQHLRDPDVVLLQVGDSSTFAKRHIPGAQAAGLERLAANATMESHHDSALMVEMLPPDVLRTRLEALGISDRSRIIVYAGTSDWATPATRVVYTLRVAGLGARTALLDGGLATWTAEGRPVTTGPTSITSGTISARPLLSLVVDGDWVRTHLNRKGVLLVDARARSFYDGVEQGEARIGHIPTAHNIPFSDVFDDHAKLKSPAALQSLFAAAGAQPGDTVVAYCHVGIQATAVLFAAETLGYPVRLYDGSFEDWARRRELPVDNPAAQAPRKGS